MRVTHKNNDQTRFLSLKHTRMHANTITDGHADKKYAKLIKHDQQFVSM